MPLHFGAGLFFGLSLLLSSCSSHFFVSQLDKLLEIAAQENKLVKHELFIRGKDLTFWSRPLTIAEYQLAKKQSKNPEDVLETTARLFIRKALDQSGSPQFQIDALPILLSKLSMATAAKIMAALSDDEDEIEEAGEAYDLKSSEGAAKKARRTAD